MIETDEEGNRQINVLIKNREDAIFNDWEQEFIRDLIGKKYSRLNSREKAIVTRLIGWLTGK